MPPVEDRYRMDGHKLLWHLDRVAAWQRGERIAPLHIDMGIATGCNMACSYCYGVIQGRKGYGTDDVRGTTAMPRDSVLQVWRQAKETGVRSIALIGEGENTLHPEFCELLEAGRDASPDLSLATNGVRLPRERLETLLRSLEWIRINISAADPEAYRALHGVPHFERVVGNVRALLEARERVSADCTIGLQMIVTYENVDQVVPLAKLGAELGVDYLVVKSCSDTPDGRLNSPNGDYRSMTRIFHEAEAQATADYVVSVKWEKLGNAGLKDYGVCFGTQFIIAISGDGSVFPCGHWFDVRRQDFWMGNVVEQSFREIVESERYWQVQRRILELDVHRECESNCRQHYVNRFLAPLRDEPVHRNFV